MSKNTIKYPLYSDAVKYLIGKHPLSFFGLCEGQKRRKKAKKVGIYCVALIIKKTLDPV